MKYELYNNKRELEYTIKNKEKVKKELLTILFNKYIYKSQHIKQVQYSYNYKDLQKITFIYSNNYRIVFYDIPTNNGTLNI